MKKMLYLMSLVALLFCYSCNTGSSNSKRDKTVSIMNRAMQVYNEGMERVCNVSGPHELHSVTGVYDDKMERLEDELETLFGSKDEFRNFVDNDQELRSIYDECRILESRFEDCCGEMKRRFEY